METQIIQTDNRNYGIDLLRILCMVMVPVLHILKTFLGELPVLSIQYDQAYLLEAIVFSAVNCFALISGFVGYGRKFCYSSILRLLLQVLFYTVPTAIVFLMFRPHMVGVRGILQSWFPFAYPVYWYYTAYFCMSFFIPALNFLVDRMEKKALQGVLLAAFFVFSLLPTLFRSDIGNTASGYSALWLGLLYIFGAYIKKYGLLQKQSQGKLLLGFGVLTLANWAVKLTMEAITGLILDEPLQDGYLLSNTSPTVVLSAVALLLLFSRMQPGKFWVGFAKYFAPAAFGAYLFYENQYIRAVLVVPVSRWLSALPGPLMLIGVLSFAVLLWLGGSMLDKLRIMLFDMFRVKKLCQKVEQWVFSLLDKIEI